MNGMLDIFRRDSGRRRSVAKAHSARRRRRQQLQAVAPETLERRSMLAVDVSEAGGALTILYNQADPVTGLVSTSDQHVTIDIEDFDVNGDRIVNVYTASNPTAQRFTGIDLITVTVPNFDDPGVNNNSLTIKGIDLTGSSDRIIMTGSGRTAAGRWSDLDPTAPDEVLFEISGIDDLTLTAGGIINVSGSFTNDTNDASIKAFGTEPEEFAEQYAGTVVVGETTPVAGTLPHPGLYSNFIEVVGAEIDILGDILATDQVILRAGEKTDAGQSLVLPYDITVTGSETTGAAGRLELYSTKNIVQLQGSTITSSELVAVSNDADATAPGGPWMIDLGSENNDFDTISLGMISAPGNSSTTATEGRIGIRDRDDLVVADVGILAATGRVTINALGALRFESPIQATGLTAISNHSIVSVVNAAMTIGDGGIQLQASDAFDETATGDITLAGRIVVDDTNATAVVSNKIVAKGTATINGAIYAPLAGSTTISGSAGVVINAPVQVGSSKLNATSTVLTVYDHDLMLISDAGSIIVADAPGGDAVPRTIQATNIISFDAASNVDIKGAVFAGTLYGNPLALVETEALPAITIVAGGQVDLAATGTLQTSSYENSADDFPNPLLGLLSITEANQVNLDGRVIADGAVDIDVTGDIYLYGPVTARESITAATTTGSIDVQGAVRSTGYSYAGTPPSPLLEQRIPNVTVSAPLGGITTSGLGTLYAGTALFGGTPTYGQVTLTSQQDIVIDADIDTSGAFSATTKLGSFLLGALLRTGKDGVSGSDLTASITAYNGIVAGLLPLDPADSGTEFGQIHTEKLDLLVTNFDPVATADITLTSPGNRIDRLVVRNFSPNGTTSIVNDTVTNGPVLDVSLVDVVGDFSLTSTSTIGIDGVVQSTQGDITVVANSGGINVQSTIRAPEGGVTLTASGQIVQRGGNVTTIYLLSGGRNYSYALVTVDPPPGAGDRALVSAEITPYPSPPPASNIGDGVTGFISKLPILNGGWGYPSGSRVALTIDGDGEGAAAVAETSIVTSSIEARDDVTLTGGDGITLVSAVRSATGNVGISATLGDVSVQSITAGKAVDVAADRGKVTLVTVQANEGVTLDGNQGVRVTGSLTSTGGDVSLDAANGDLTFLNDLISGDAPQAVLSAPGGQVSLTSRNGGIVSPFTINAGKDVKFSSFNTLALTNEVTSQGGDIVATSTSGRISLASNLVAETGSITLESQTSMVQEARTGVTSIELLSAGDVSSTAPQVTVTVAAPRAGGGRPAVAAAVIERRQVEDGTGPGADEYEYFIGSIVVLDPGEGYAVGEQPLVSITGVNGALARAYGPTALQMVMARKDITVDAGENVTLITKVHSVEGDVVVASKTGDIDLSGDDLLISAKAGTIGVAADRGSVTIERLAAGGSVTVDALQGLVVENNVYSASGAIALTSRNDAATVRNLNAGNGVTVASFKSATLAGEIAAQSGDIAARSSSGGIFLDANVVAETGKIAFDAQTFLVQSDATGIQAVEVIDRGSIVLGAGAEPPTVTVTIAAPADPRGIQATAIAILGRRTLGGDGGNENVEWFIETIRITNHGRGYALGENPITLVTGIGAAVAQAIGPTNVRNLSALSGITITAGHDVTLLYEATARNGDITIMSVTGDLALGASQVLLQALDAGNDETVGSVVLVSECGTVEVQRICADEDVRIVGEAGVTVLTSVDADGRIDVDAETGLISLNGEILADRGPVDVNNTSSRVQLAANIQSLNDSILVSAHGGVTQLSGSGLRRIDVLTGGESAGTRVPVVTVTVAAPANGGTPASAFARLRAFTNLEGDQRYTIDEIVITSPGQGYEINESPIVTITGIDGASALAIGPISYQNITAKNDVKIFGGETVTLLNTIRSTTGDIVVTSIDGDVQVHGADAFLHAEAGSVTLESDCHDVTVQRICAAEDVLITAGEAVTVFEAIDAGGKIAIQAGIGDVTLNGQIYAKTGAITVGSTSADISLSANIHADQNAIAMKAHGGLTQSTASGLTAINVLFGGESDEAVPPVVTVDIAAPARGGTQATAFARLRSFVNVAGNIRYTVASVELTNPGSGYFLGEIPAVTIRGINGAAAVAVGPNGYENIVADGDITVEAREDILLVSTVSSDTGDIRIRSIDGLVDVSATTSFLHALQGAVEVESECDTVTVYKVCAEDDVVIIGESSVTLVREIESDTGVIDVRSGNGWIFTTAQIQAVQQSVSLRAHGGVQQSANTGVQRVDLLAQGAFVGNAAPTVTVVIDPPDGGGRAATAEAVLVQLGFTNELNPRAIWGIRQIVITDPGSGYAIGERPLVRITGLPGATAVAIGPTSFQTIVANTAVTIAGGDDITLLNAVRSNTTNITISSIDGDLNLGDQNFVAHALDGSVTLDADSGSIEVFEVYANENVTIAAGNQIEIVSRIDSAIGDIVVDGDGFVLVQGVVNATAGDVRVSSAAEAVSLNAVIRATQGEIEINAGSEVIQQAASGISQVEVVSSGSRFTEDPGSPSVVISIAPPRAGGVTATAEAVLSLTEIPDGLDTDYLWTIDRIVILNPGEGYAVGETPLVTITGMPGAVARAIGPLARQDLTAGRGITVAAKADVTLVTTLTATGGDIEVSSASGDLNLGFNTFFAHALAGSVTLESECGTVVVDRVCAEVDVTVFGERGVTVETDIDAGRNITLTASAGAVIMSNLAAGNAITVASQATINITGNIVATAGDIDVTSTSGAINLQATVHAINESIAIKANQGIEQTVTTGLARIDLLTGGQFTGSDAPVVTVTVAAPATGGTAATAEAILVQTGSTGGPNPEGVWTIGRIVIVSPGSGYAVNESPTVTITGMPGASARAFGPSSDQAVIAGTNLTVLGGDDVVLVRTFRADAGNIRIESIDGDLDLSADTFFAHALAGSVVLDSDCGTVIVERVCAADDVVINGEQGVTVENEAESEDGDVTISATSGEANILNVNAGKNVTISAGDTFTLLGVIDSEAGDISLTSRNRDLDFTASGAQVHALQGGVALAALNGSIMSPPTLNASKNVTLTSFNTLVLNNEITSDTGVIDLKSTSGSINLNANLDARDDSIRINAKGSVTQIGGGIGFVRVLSGGSGYTSAATIAIAAPSSGVGVAARATPIIGRVNGVNGVITGIRLTSPGSGYGAGEMPAVTINRNGTPPIGATEASAMAAAAPALGNSGLAAIDVLTGGSGYGATTVVTIAPPAGGGTAATAQAVIGSVNGVDGVIVDIVIVNPGSGYGAGEQPTVTITGGGTGAAARAIANITLQDIRAGQNIDIVAGTGVTLLNTVRADLGDVAISSDTGNVNLAARTQLISSFGGDISVTARRGAIVAQRLAADGDITLDAMTGVTLLNAVNTTGNFGTGDLSIKTLNGNIATVAPNALISVQNGGVALESVNGQVFTPQVFNVPGDISLKTYGNQTINQQLTSASGSVTVASATGAVTVAANIVAEDRVTLAAKTGITQSRGVLQGEELVATNASNAAVTLTNSTNDFENVAITSLGAVTYVDADDFEIGVKRGGPLEVEMAGDALTLSSVATNSRIRVVSGLRYRTLSIAAGTQGGTNVGYVDYVTTSGGDNPQANAAFQGTLRDMIRYVNDNTATYVAVGGTRVPQLQAMVFDEMGYAVEEVKLGAALPVFTRPVFFDGGRLEESATVDRIGIAGTSAIAYGLAFAPARAAVPGVRAATPGSTGSTIQHVAAYGFTKGSAIVLASGNNTVLDLHAGLKADGTVPGNFIGLDVSGAAATNNQIGVAVFDPATANRFGGNTSAGILFRNGASGNRVFGSVIGDDTGVTPALANGDGIRINNSTGNIIGTPDMVQSDLGPSRSNRIVGNGLAGIQINNSVAGTIGAANVIRNNYVAGNTTGVGITASRFAVLGGTDGRSANVIVGQTGAGVAVSNSTNVQIQGNRVGVVPAFEFDAEDVFGNATDGIAIGGTSQQIEISNGNWIAGNKGNGVAVGAGVTGVMLADNTIGGTLGDGRSAGNMRDGVAITAAVGNAVGTGNWIANNGRHGVSVTDARAATPQAGNRVFGSVIAKNAGSGVVVTGGSGTTIGGSEAGTANVITGNAAHGVRIDAVGSTTGAATGHAVQGNRIGTNGNGEINATLGNKLSGISISGATGVVVGNRNMVMNNARNGIEVIDGSGATIGSATAAAGNVITNNARSGVAVGVGATGVTVMGNTIAAQGGDGVIVAPGARGVTIGQTVTQRGVTGAGNSIQGNRGWGVRIGGGAQQIAVQGNAMADNVLGAIFQGAAANSVAPTTVTITSAITRTASGGARQIVVSGSLVGAGIKARQQYSVDVYASPASATNPQAGRFIGRFNVTATTNGRVDFSNVAITANVAVDVWITATATSLVFDPGSTSALSAPRRATLR